MKNKMKPIHPGAILQEELDMSANAFAKCLSALDNRYSTILYGKRFVLMMSLLRIITLKTY